MQHKQISLDANLLSLHILRQQKTEEPFVSLKIDLQHLCLHSIICVNRYIVHP